MSDLRGQLIEALPNLGLGRTDWEGEQTVNALMPIIEAELQKEQREISRWIRDCQSLIEELNAANKLLEQTIEVLEGSSLVLIWHEPELWETKAKPLLDKLQALKKEGTE